MALDLDGPIDRRGFLVRISNLGVGAVITVSGLSAVNLGCNDKPESGGSRVISTTFPVDMASGHDHTFTIPQTAFDNPPAAGFTAPTSVDSGHSHQIVLSQADLINIAGSVAVVGTSAVAAGHVHTFTFV